MTLPYGIFTMKSEPRFGFERELEEGDDWIEDEQHSEDGVATFDAIAEEVQATISPMIVGSAAELIAANGQFPAESRASHFDLTRHPDGTAVKGQLTNATALAGKILEVEHNLPDGVQVGYRIPGFMPTTVDGNHHITGETRGTKQIGDQVGALIPIEAPLKMVFSKAELEATVKDHPNDSPENPMAGQYVPVDGLVVQTLQGYGYTDPVTGRVTEYDEELREDPDMPGHTYLPKKHIAATISRHDANYSKAKPVDLTNFSPTFKIYPIPGKTLEESLADSKRTKPYKIGFRATVAYAGADNASTLG